MKLTVAAILALTLFALAACTSGPSKAQICSEMLVEAKATTDIPHGWVGSFWGLESLKGIDCTGTVAGGIVDRTWCAYKTAQIENEVSGYTEEDKRSFYAESGCVRP